MQKSRSVNKQQILYPVSLSFALFVRLVVSLMKVIGNGMMETFKANKKKMTKILLW